MHRLHVCFGWIIFVCKEYVFEFHIKYRNHFWDPAWGHPLGGQVVLVQRVNLEYLECLEHLERGEFLEAKESEAIRDRKVLKVTG
jgi:hypothetical protein